MVATVMLQEMTWPEAESALEEAPCVLVPLGAFEQHGRHLPLETDYRLALSRCKIIAERTGAVVAPVARPGCSAHHLGFAGTIALSDETMLSLLHDVAASLSRSGVERLALINGHGGNDTVAALAASQIEEETGVSVAVFGVGDLWEFSPMEPEDFDLHAGVQETAAMYIYAPDMVREEQVEQPELTPGFDPEEVTERFSWRTAKRLFGLGVHPVKELSSNGIITYRDPAEGKDMVPERQELEDRFIDMVSEFIAAWQDIGTAPRSSGDSTS